MVVVVGEDVRRVGWGRGHFFRPDLFVCALSDSVPQVPACSQVIPAVHSVHDCW